MGKDLKAAPALEITTKLSCGHSLGQTGLPKGTASQLALPYFPLASTMSKTEEDHLCYVIKSYSLYATMIILKLNIFEVYTYKYNFKMCLNLI